MHHHTVEGALNNGHDWSFHLVESNGTNIQVGKDRFLIGHAGFSTLDILAERMTHMSHWFTFTALRSALLMGDPCNTDILGKVASVSHSLNIISILHYYHVFPLMIHDCLAPSLLFLVW